MGLFSFPRQARLRRARDFGLVYRRGRRMRVPPLRICALRRAEGQSRLGMAIGRKVGGAVVRNRWKRAVREAFRLNRARLRAPYDLVISVDWEAEAYDVGCVAERFCELIEKLNEADSGREASRGDA